MFHKDVNRRKDVRRNGIPVIKNGEHTGAKAGHALRHTCALRQP
jgi:hypothetical protein